MCTNTDKHELEAGTRLAPRFDANGLVTAVVQDVDNGEILMLAHMNQEAIDKTIETGQRLVLEPLAPITMDEGRNLGQHSEC